MTLDGPSEGPLWVESLARFVGQTEGGAAAMYGLIFACRVDPVDPQAWLAEWCHPLLTTRRQTRRVFAVELEGHARQEAPTLHDCGLGRMITD